MFPKRGDKGVTLQWALGGVHGGTLEHLRLPGFSSGHATADHSQKGLLSSLGSTLSSVKWENSTCFPGLNKDQYDP